MEPGMMADFLASASQKQLAQLTQDATLPQLPGVLEVLWTRLAHEKSLHGLFGQARALASLLTLQAKWRFPLDIAPAPAFLSHFLQTFVEENPLLWNEEHLRDCESVMQTVLKYVQSAAQPLPAELLARVMALLKGGVKVPKDVCTQLGLLYHSGLQSDSDRLAAVSELTGQGRIAYLRGVIFVGAAETVEALVPALVEECKTPDVSLKHYAVNTLEVVLTKLKKQRTRLTDADRTLISEMLTQHFDYPDRAVCLRVLHVLALLLLQYSEAEVRALLERIQAVKSSFRFRLISEVLEVFGLPLVLEYFPNIVLQCAEQSLHPSSSSPAMDLLRRILAIEWQKRSVEEYFSTWKCVLALPQAVPLVLEEALRVCKGACTELLLAERPPLSTLVTVLKVCRSLKNFTPAETGVRVFSCEVPYSDLEAALTSVDLDLAADCLEVLTANPLGTAPLSSLETHLFLTYVRTALKVSDAHFRQRSLGSCRKLLLRTRASLDAQAGMRAMYADFVSTTHAELLGLVYPTSPIELLEPAMVLLDLIYQLFGSQPCTIGERRVAAMSKPLCDLYTETARVTVVGALKRPWDLIRRLSFRILSGFPVPDGYDAKLLSSPRVHEAEAQAWRLLLHMRRDAALFDESLRELRSRADSLSDIISQGDAAQFPHGLMASVRFALELGEEFAPTPERMQQLAAVLLTVSRGTSALLSKFAVDEGWDCRGHSCGVTSETTTMGMWLACKESGLLLSQYAQWMLVSSDTLPTVRSLASEFFQVLLSLKHRGAIVKTAGGLADFYSRLFREELTAQEPLLRLRQLLDLVKSSEDRALILRRSAGFPYALLTVLQSAPTTTFTATMSELLGLCEPQEAAEVRIHALNILRYVLQDRVLKTKSEQFLGQSLHAGVLALSSADWSVRNSATLTFAAVLSKALGHEYRLALSDLTARNSSLEGDLATLLISDADPYPVLLLLQRLASDSTPRPQLVKAVLRHIASRNDMVRRVAASAVANLVSQVVLRADSLRLDDEVVPLDFKSGNLVHGVLLVLAANAEKLRQEAGLESVFGLEWARWPLIGETYLQLRIALKLLADDSEVSALRDQFLRRPTLRLERDFGHSLTRLRMTEFLLASCADKPLLCESVSVAALTGPSGELLLDDPEFTHSVLKLLRRVSADFVDALCTQVLEVREPSFASCWKCALQLLLSRSRVPSWSVLTEVRLRTPAHSPLQATIAKCLLRAADKSRMVAAAQILWERCGAEEKDFVRTACAEALDESCESLKTCVHLWRVAVRLLQDQVESIRQRTAVALSKILSPEHPKNASVVLRLAFQYVTSAFPPEEALGFVASELQAACEVHKYEFSAENKARVFYKEPANGFEEPLQTAFLCLAQAQVIFEAEASLKSSQKWLSALQTLNVAAQSQLPEEESFLLSAVTRRLTELNLAKAQ